jgi:hypothetical protein
VRGRAYNLVPKVGRVREPGNDRISAPSALPLASVDNAMDESVVR